MAQSRDSGANQRMGLAKREVMTLKNSSDIVLARQKVRQWAIDLHFSLVDQSGRTVALHELLSAPEPRAVLLIFYRGYW